LAPNLPYRITYSSKRTINTKNTAVAQTRLFVSGISENDTNASLKHIFEAFGAVSDAVVMNDTTGYPKRFGFVTMASTVQADAAIAGLNGARIGSRVLSVEEAKQPPNTRKPGSKTPQSQILAKSKSLQKLDNSRSKLTSKKLNAGLKSLSKEIGSGSKTTSKVPNPELEPLYSTESCATTVVEQEQDEIDLISFD
jgi:RNA recognition motif-containing protein